MSMDVTSSSMTGAALGVRQGQNQVDFGMKSLGQSAQPEQSVAALLQAGQANPTTVTSPGLSGGGNVTPTRGQNLNIVV